MNSRLLILFNFTPSRLREIAPCAAEFGFSLRPASGSEQRAPIGSIAGPAPADPLSAPSFGEEMMLFSCPESETVFRFLARLRETGIRPPALKAVITPHNYLWTPERLYRELKAEQTALNGAAPR